VQISVGQQGAEYCADKCGTARCAEPRVAWAGEGEASEDCASICGRGMCGRARCEPGVRRAALLDKLSVCSSKGWNKGWGRVGSGVGAACGC